MTLPSKDYLFFIDRTVATIDFYRSLDKTKNSYLSEKLDGYIKRNLNTIFIHNERTHHFSKKNIIQAQELLTDPGLRQKLANFHAALARTIPDPLRLEGKARFISKIGLIVSKLFKNENPDLNPKAIEGIQDRIVKEFPLKQGASKKHHFSLLISRDMINEIRTLTDHDCRAIHEIQAQADLEFARVLLNLKPNLAFSSCEDLGVLSDFLHAQVEILKKCGATLSSQFIASVDRSCDCIVHPKNRSSALEKLQNNDPDSFLIIPLITTSSHPHTLGAIIRIIDGLPRMVIANKGGDRLNDLLTLEQYQFKDLKTLQSKLVSIPQRQLTSKQIYEVFSDAHQNSLLAPGRPIFQQPAQRVNNCLIKQVEYAFKWALMTSDTKSNWIGDLKRSYQWPVKRMHDLYVDACQQTHTEHDQEFQVILDEYHSPLRYLAFQRKDPSSGCYLGYYYPGFLGTLRYIMPLVESATFQEALKHLTSPNSPMRFLADLQKEGFLYAYQTARSEFVMICCMLAKKLVKQKEVAGAIYMLQQALAADPHCSKARGYLAFLQKDRSALRGVCQNSPFDLIAKDRYQLLCQTALQKRC
jgi:hypothetical protein